VLHQRGIRVLGDFSQLECQQFHLFFRVQLPVVRVRKLPVVRVRYSRKLSAVRVCYSRKLNVVKVNTKLVRDTRDDNAKDGEGCEEAAGGYF
jgi:hypothetical protein